MKYLVIITGPTGIGKTDLSVRVAQTLGCEIVSCDSRQIYKEMTIGTAVPEKEELEAIQHHLIQTVSIEEYYNVSRYEQDALSIIQKLHKEKDVVVLTGGTGLYIEAVCNGIDIMPDPDPSIREALNKQFAEDGIESLQNELKKVDPEYYNVVDLKNHARLIRALEMYHQTGKPFSAFRKTDPKKRPFKTIKIALNMDREVLYDRINLRVDKMIENGLIQEARSLYPKKHLTALKTVGYQELFEAFDGAIPLEKGIEKIKNNSRKYARKQISWIRRDKDYQWFHPKEIQQVLDYVIKKVKC